MTSSNRIQCHNGGMLTKIKLSVHQCRRVAIERLAYPLAWAAVGLGLLLPVSVHALEAGSAPEGFKLAADLELKVYASGVPGARMMTRSDDGTVYVGTRDEGRVYALRDLNGDGTADEVRTVLEGLRFPNGVAILEGDLYIAELTRLIRVRQKDLQSPMAPSFEVVYDGFPPEPHHGWRTLEKGPDGWLYLAIGVPCNSCKPAGPLQGRLIRIHPHEGRMDVLAEGLRNSVGLAFEPKRSVLWLTEHGRDYLGDEWPPDELNRYDGHAVHYGFPFCHGQKIVDPEFGDVGHCAEQQPPAWEFPAHVAPIGLLFYEGTALPERFHGQCLVAQHGSWNRADPSGYRLVLIRMENGRPVSETVFVEGWLTPQKKVKGRPVDLLELPDGSLLISDDHADVIYRLTANAAEVHKRAQR